MLSVENPPPDPPCRPPFHLLQTSDDQKRASDCPTLSDLDLFTITPSPHLDDTHLPNFSIRDYVYSARSKDIKTNWPFSEKNLQLCLKHGVKDLLPPFQSLDPVRSSLPEQTENIGDHRLPSFSGDATWNRKKAAAGSHLDVDSCRSEGETNLVSTITSNSQADIESVPTNKTTSSSAIETANPLETLLEAEVIIGGKLVASKIENNTPSSSKKCRLIVKFSTISNPPSSTADIASTLSEAMTSIICPVCKTFSSSSNTTLNAHIDQCLSVDSTSKWMPDSRITSKYKIKPRKMRSMVDIYVTAPRCTLEELDRRNGSSWATGSALPNQHADQVRDQGKKQRASPVFPEDAADEGEVYFDANGTKLRILSKFNTASSVSQVGENPRQRESLKGGGNGSKFVSTNKKKHCAVKRQKYLNLTLQNNKVSSPKSSSSQMHKEGQDGDYGVEGLYKEEHLTTQNFGAQEHIKPSGSGTLRQWVCSKRTGLSKKIKTKDNNQQRMATDLLVENDQTGLGVSNTIGSHAQRLQNSLQKPIACENNQRAGSSFCGTPIDNARKHSIARKKVRRSSVGDQMGGDVERSCDPLSQNSFELSKDGTSMRDSFLPKTLKYKKDHASFLSRKKPKIIAAPVESSEDSLNVSTYPSRGCQAFSSKVIRFPTLKKKVLRLSESSVPEARINSSSKNNSTFKKYQVRCTEEMGEEVAAWPSEMDEDYYSMPKHTENKFGEEITDKGSLGRSSVQKIRRKRGAMSFPRMDKNVVGRDINSSAGIIDDFSGKFDGLESARRESQFCGKDSVTEQSLKMAAGGSIMGPSRSLQSEYEKLDYSSDTESDSLQSVEEYKGNLCEAESPVGCSADPSLGEGREMFCANGVDDGIIGQKAYMGEEMGSKVRQGNDFPEIDPIPIPGPPGSFLPSPRDMGSEEFQGNSSVTTIRINSSQDQHYLVDGDSSDSPISATSTLSNSTAARSDLNCAEELLSVAFHAKDKIQYEFSGATVEAVVENVSTLPQTTNTGSDRSITDVKSLKVNVISPKSGPLKFKDDNQPCCCSRKERISQGIALNFQESQLLKRRNMVSVPATAKQGWYPNTTPELFCFSKSPKSGAEKVVLPVLNSSAGASPLKSSFGTTVKLPSSGYSDSASPSASTPILRLMGKNLMVVNKDEDSAHMRQSQPGSPNRSIPQNLNYSGASPQNWDHRSSSDHRVPQDSVNMAHGFHNTAEQSFDVRFSNSLRNHTNSVTRQAPPIEAEASMLPGKRNGSNLESLELHEYMGQCNFPSQICRRKNSLESTYHDDAPENEVGWSTGDFKYPKGLMGSQLSPGGISIPAAPDCSLRHVNPYSCHQPRNPSSLGELQGVHDAFFHVPHSKQAGISPVYWTRHSDGSTVLQHGTFMASSSSSTSQLRSAFYFSPRLS